MWPEKLYRNDHSNSFYILFLVAIASPVWLLLQLDFYGEKRKFAFIAMSLQIF